MIDIRHINKSFDGNMILNNFSLSIKQNEFVTIMGASGSGKTTILNLLGCLDKPDSGIIEVNGIKNPNTKQIKQLRRYHFGYIFQNYFLMNNETVRTNLQVSKAYSKDFSEDKMVSALKRVGLEPNALDKKVFQLSGGEQQRVSIARVILKPSTIIFADEPTGNLDEKNKNLILELLQDLKKEGKTIVCVTHDPEVAKQSDRIIEI